MSANDYDFDPEAAGHAEDVLNRIDHSGPYVGEFTYAEKVISKEKGTLGMKLGFDDGHGGKCELTLWTKKADGTPLFGFNIVQAILCVLGLKGLKPVKGKVYSWNEETKKSRDLEEDGEVYPDLLKKRIGLVLQKELKNNEVSGKEFFNMNIFGVFQDGTRLTATEIKEKKVKAEKFEKMTKTVKDKDSRTKGKKSEEPAQPSMGADGGY